MKQNFGLSGLTPKFIILMLVMSITPLLITWKINDHNVQETLSDQINNNLNNITKSLSGYISQWIELHLVLLKQTAELPEIKSMDKDPRHPALQAIQKEYNWIYLAFTIDLEGNNTKRSDGKSLKQYGDRSYFLQVAKQNREIGQQVLVGRTSGKPALILSVPIKDENEKIIGVNAIALHLTELSQQIADVNIGETGFAFLLDENANVIAHPDEEYTKNRKSLVEHAAYKAYKEQGKKDVVFVENGKKVIAHVIPTIFDWVIITQQDYDEAFKPLKDSLILNLIVLVSTIVLILILAYIVSNVALKSIRGLSSNMLKIDSFLKEDNFVELGEVKLDINLKDEIGLLNRITRDLVEDIQISHATLIDINKTLEERIEERTKDLSKAYKKVQDSQKDLAKAYKKLQESQSQLIQSEKMASLGQMVAGVAHEINTPLGYVRSSIESSQVLVEDLLELANEYNLLLTMVFSENPDEEAMQAQFAKVQQLSDSLGQEEMTEDFAKIFKNTFYGLDQIAELVNSLKNFSRKEESKVENISINDCVNNSLLISKNAIKRIQIETQLDENLLPITGSPSQINQVLINMINNAAQAVEEKTGKLIITTKQHKDFLEIKIQDNGKGIPKEIMNKIFDPFFTTKKVGEGTGLGLSISFKIIQQHQGKINVKSVVGKGTVFQIILPTNKKIDRSFLVEEK